MRLSRGQVLQSWYRVEKLIVGSTVYLATDIALDKPVVIKQFGVDIRDEERRSRAVSLFQQQAAGLATLKHPGLVELQHCFEEDGDQYLVMPLVEGCSLSRLIAPLPSPIVVDWALQLCDVLHYLHTHSPQIVFMNLNPSHVMVDVSGRIKLINFGLARFFKGTLTAAGYAPPEQYGGATDSRSDIYALGCTLYTLLTGIVPPGAIERLMGEVRLKPLRAFNPTVPEKMEAIVCHMMELKRGWRFQDVAAVRLELTALPATTPASEETIHCSQCELERVPYIVACPRCDTMVADATSSETEPPPPVSKDPVDRYSVTVSCHFAESPFTRTIDITSVDHVQTVLNRIYLLICGLVEPFTYLQSWILRDATGVNLVMYEVTTRVPAHYIFTEGSHWHIVPLPRPYDPEEYVVRTHRIRQPK